MNPKLVTCLRELDRVKSYNYVPNYVLRLIVEEPVENLVIKDLQAIKLCQYAVWLSDLQVSDSRYCTKFVRKLLNTGFDLNLGYRTETLLRIWSRSGGRCPVFANGRMLIGAGAHTRGCMVDAVSKPHMEYTTIGLICMREKIVILSESGAKMQPRVLRKFIGNMPEIYKWVEHTFLIDVMVECV